MKKIENVDKQDQLKNAEENKFKIKVGILSDQRYSQLLDNRKSINDKQFLQQLDKLKYEDRKMLLKPIIESKSQKVIHHQSSPQDQGLKKHYLNEQERLRELDQIKRELRDKSTKAQNKIDSLRIGEVGAFRNIINNNIIDKQEERFERQRHLEKQNDLKLFLQEQIFEQKQRQIDEKAYNRKILEIQSLEMKKSIKKEKKKQEQINEVNKRYADYLRKQIEEKKAQQKQRLV